MPGPAASADVLLDPSVVAAIARAERRREMLERLSDLGLRLAQDLADRTAAAAAEVEPRHDPGRAFAAISRAVRFSLALEAKVDQEILALMRGELVSPFAVAGGRSAPGEPAPEQQAWTPPPTPPFDALKARIGACVYDAIDEGCTDAAAADDLCAAAHERLFEREDYHALIFRPFRETVELICGDLGLTPDWSRWDDEAGFPPETRRTDHTWSRDWVVWPSGARLRRSYNAVPREDVLTRLPHPAAPHRRE